MSRFKGLSPGFIKFIAKDCMKSEKITKLGFPTYLCSFFPPFPSRAMGRHHTALIKSAKGFRTPEMVNIAITSNCQYNCWHCSTHGMESSEASTEAWEKVLLQLKQQGTYQIGFSGGEPLLHNGIVKLIEATKGWASTILYTTGTGLYDDLARSFKKAGLDTICISLDHKDKKIHNSLRKHSEAFSRAIAAIKISKKHKFITAVSTVATAERVESGELMEFAAWLKTLDIDELIIFEPSPSGKLTGQGHAMIDQDTRQKIWDFHREANNCKNLPRVISLSWVEGPEMMGCGAGYNRIYITPSGHVTPCDFVPLSFGNVFEEDLKIIWERMADNFHQPRPSCMCRSIYTALAKESDGSLPLVYDKSKHICESFPANGLPEFYKRLFNKKD